MRARDVERIRLFVDEISISCQTIDKMLENIIRKGGYIWTYIQRKIALRVSASLSYRFVQSSPLRPTDSVEKCINSQLAHIDKERIKELLNKKDPQGVE